MYQEFPPFVNSWSEESRMKNEAMKPSNHVTFQHTRPQHMHSYISPPRPRCTRQQPHLPIPLFPLLFTAINFSPLSINSSFLFYWAGAGIGIRGASRGSGWEGLG